MKTFVKASRKNEKSNNVALKAVAIITNVDKEKLHRPDLRPRIEGALKDFHLQLEEGEDVRFSRMMGQYVELEKLDDFENDCVEMFDFINTLEIPTEEEANSPAQIVKLATDEEMKFVKAWLDDLKDDELLHVDYISFWKNGISPGRISGALMKKLLTTFLQTYGQ
jgi:hypothetical protein